MNFRNALIGLAALTSVEACAPQMQQVKNQEVDTQKGSTHSEIEKCIPPEFQDNSTNYYPRGTSEEYRFAQNMALAIVLNNPESYPESYEDVRRGGLYIELYRGTFSLAYDMEKPGQSRVNRAVQRAEMCMKEDKAK